MSKKYAAFLSYSSRYVAWVEVLQRNLEGCLAAAGDARPVFLDRLDLGVGRSWVSGLQAGLDEADQLVLVVTPEALASPRVEDEWGSFIARDRGWKGRLQVAVLVETPLPPFLEPIQHVDFQDHDDARYRRALQQLVGGLLGLADQRTPVALPDGVETPAAPAGLVPTAIRRALVAWLEEKLQLKAFRPAIAGCLGVHLTALEGYPSLGCAASAAVVQSTGEDDPPTAALRIVRALKETFEEQAGSLIKLEEELQQLLGSGPERGLLGVWRQCLARQHAELLPAFFEQGGEHAPLEQVYVQLELRPEVARQTQEPDPSLVRPLALGELLALGRADHPWITGRWVVLGDPGAGKTTLLRHLAWRLAREQEPRWTPVFDSLPRLMREREWLLERMEWQLGQAGQPARGLATVLDRAGQEGRLLLLLDGLDEVSLEHRERLELLLRELSARWPESPLVVSSRPIGYRRPVGEFREVELLPLGEEQQRELLARWFGRRNGSQDTAWAEAALARLTGEPSLRELASNPLYLTLMALLLEEGKEPDRNRPRLYDQVFKLLLAGRHRPGCEAIAAHAAVRAALRYLANAMTVDNRESEPVEEIEARLYQPAADALREPLERVPSWRRSLRPFLDDVAERTSILGPHDGPGGDWRFLHRTFREALVAEALEGTYRAEGSAALLRQVRADVGDKSRWAEPFALLTGRLEEPDDLVRALVAADRTLGLRAIATAQNLRDETVREVLELSEEWRERAEVYQRIPELVDDPSRALALLDQLRQKTTNGNDLFFLGQAAAAVGERWPDARRSVARLQADLYAHLPIPADELFRSIDTPLDGRVALWREIPAGSFRMGSPPEEQGDNDERPQHEVTVTSPFHLAAVPVTHGQYLAFDPTHRSFFGDQVSAEELKHHPVDSVTWYEAMAFCGWLARHFPGARLPTEEEWEYACRAGTATPYWSGSEESDLKRVGWYDKNSDGRTHRVGKKPANGWGLYDVHGNVWEWTLSERSDYAQRQGGVAIDPQKADLAGASGAHRVMRGGSCWSGARWARAAYRFFGVPGVGLRDQGFRVLLPFPPRAFDDRS